MHLVYQVFENVISDRDKNNVLVIGVGKSDVIEVLHKKGFREIVAIDVSPTVINLMRSRYKHLDGVEWYCMDIRELNVLKDKSFSIVIDKGKRIEPLNSVNVLPLHYRGICTTGCFDAGFCHPDFDDASKKYCSVSFK